MKELLPVLQPSLNDVLNDSFREGFLPTVIKMAIITPVLKSKQLDPDVLNNFRPVSNLTILSKIFEKCVLKQLNDHLQRNGLYASYQIAYRPFHSFETALINIYSDVLEGLI